MSFVGKSMKESCLQKGKLSFKSTPCWCCKFMTLPCNVSLLLSYEHSDFISLIPK